MLWQLDCVPVYRVDRITLVLSTMCTSGKGNAFGLKIWMSIGGDLSSLLKCLLFA